MGCNPVLEWLHLFLFVLFISMRPILLVLLQQEWWSNLSRIKVGFVVHTMCHYGWLSFILFHCFILQKCTQTERKRKWNFLMFIAYCLIIFDCSFSFSLPLSLGVNRPLPVGALGDVDLSADARCLSAARQIHRVTKQTVAGHPLSYHPSHHLPRVDPYRHLQYNWIWSYLMFLVTTESCVVH